MPPPMRVNELPAPSATLVGGFSEPTDKSSLWTTRMTVLPALGAEAKPPVLTVPSVTVVEIVASEFDASRGSGL